MTGRASFGRAAFGGPSGLETPAPGQQQLPPPIPGGTSVWYYTRHPSLAFGIRAWGGGSSVIQYPGGGISLRPIPARGVMEVTTWWPNAIQLSLVRVLQDGTRQVVRGANPLQVSGQTRTNLCQNPSLEADAAGWLADAGAPTLARVAVAPAPRGGFYLRATTAATGSNGVTVPTAITPGVSLTVGFDLWLRARPTGFTVTVNWADGAGTPLTPTVVPLTANEINRSVVELAEASAVFARQVVQVATPANGVTATLKLTATGMPSSGTNVMGIDGVTVERGVTDGSYFDGNTYGAQWTGVASDSTSVLAPVVVFEDGECPTDQPVSYQLINPALTGGIMESPQVTLESRGITWLTHPLDSSNPRRVVLDKVPDETEEAIQGKFVGIGARYKVVISAAQRVAPTGKIGFQVLSWAERNDLRALFRDLSPVLLRPPADYGYGAGLWVVLGSLLQDPGDHLAYHDTRLLSADYDEVEALVT